MRTQLKIMQRVVWGRLALEDRQRIRNPSRGDIGCWEIPQNGVLKVYHAARSRGALPYSNSKSR